MIELRKVLETTPDEISAVSRVLNSGAAKLDCTDVYDLNPEQLDALFSHIRTDWKKWQELNNFIELRTAHEDLRLVIREYLPTQKPEISEIVIDLTNGTDETSETSSNNEEEDRPPSKARWIVGFLILIGSLGFVGLGIKSLPYFLSSKLQTDSLTIGTLYEVESQTKLANYLRDNLVTNNYFDFIAGKKIEIIVDGDKTLSYQEAQNRIEAKEWDIAFTMSPINSIFARNSGYTFLGKMFPNSQSYQSGLFVRKDSNIYSLDDLKPTTTVALGNFTSASSFYMPVFDLYGKTLTVKTGNRGPKIVEMVKQGQVDIGAAAIGDSIRANDPELRIIHQSREIPSSGVYLSPSLSSQDRQTITKLMLDAPQDIKKQSNYDAGQEPDYAHLEKIVERIDKVLLCADFNSSQVKLFCPAGFTPTIIEGKVNGWSAKKNGYILKIVNLNKEIFNIFVTPQILQKALGITEIKNLQGTTIKIQSRTQSIRQSNGRYSLDATQLDRISLIK